MEKVVHKLEEIAKRMQLANGAVMPTLNASFKGKGERAVANPWTDELISAIESFPSHIEDLTDRGKLEQVCQEVDNMLGPETVDACTGYFNAVRLFRILRTNKMDVDETKAMVAIIANGRVEHKINSVRRHIVNKDLTFDTLPGAREFATIQPCSEDIGKTNDGRHIMYRCFGTACDFDKWKRKFSIKRYLELVTYHEEMVRMLLTARCAIEGRDIGKFSVYNFAGGSLVSLERGEGDLLSQEIRQRQRNSQRPLVRTCS